MDIGQYYNNNKSSPKLPFLTQRWFEWWCSFSQEPKTGQIVDDGVFFLTSKKMERYDNAVLETHNVLPQQLPVLFPVDKWLGVGFPFTPDEELKRVAKERIDQLPNMSVKIDDQVVIPIRVQTAVFELKLARDIPNPEVGNNVKSIKKGKYKKAVCEGYWVFLEPNTLTKGLHTIPSFASCATGVLSLNVRHTLNVV